MRLSLRRTLILRNAQASMQPEIMNRHLLTGAALQLAGLLFGKEILTASLNKINALQVNLKIILNNYKIKNYDNTRNCQPFVRVVPAGKI